MPLDDITSTAAIDPESAFASPEAVLAERSLTADQKRDLLDRWEFAVNARLAAGGEGMPVGAAREAKDSELVRAIGRVRNALERTRKCPN